MLGSLSRAHEVQVLCRPEHQPLLAALPWLPPPLVVGGPGSWPALLWRLRRQPWDSIWDLSQAPLTPWRQSLPFLIPSPHRLLLAGSSPFKAQRLEPGQHQAQRFSGALATLGLWLDHQWLPAPDPEAQRLLEAIGERPLVAINLLDDDGQPFMPLVEQFRALLQGLPKAALVLLHPLPEALAELRSPRLFSLDKPSGLSGWQLLARAQSLLGVDSAWVQRAAVLGVAQLAIFPEDRKYLEDWHPNDLKALVWRYQDGEPLPLAELLAKLRKLHKSLAEPSLNLV
ncbi:hypothetical protein PVT67_05430 [Gallaecimonas kandeliae]|uniref:glycosyltransferase family 9 protein n=1 Tax=Gallaecimonas kandeliae TaxID=3029055 RepID=UPI0026485527|nr:hypothetical protein [Gallaecimonas kandeliae]WKE66686.1 hypothetical protein PVT67_05430 [Gallaecimonas kandeliae]